MCTHVGVLRDGRLILQEELETILRPTGLVAVRSPDIDRCTALLGETVASVEGDQLLVRANDPARLNAYLVGEDVRVEEIGPYRRSLEKIVLEAEART
jgi:ABC-type multidrug transport system ATPase subunit